MRENMGLFRGKSAYTEEWVHGYYVRLYDVNDVSGESHRIYPGRAESDCGDLYPDWYEAEPATVGECTGLRDKNGKLIFEGDILAHDESPCCYGAVSYYEDYGMFIMTVSGEDLAFADFEPYEYEIIGNIHDNPELIGGVKE